jgi:hypothetical protein
MSLRKGHLASKQWAPPTHRDDWRDEAKCAGLMDDMIPGTYCSDCPVKTECIALFDQMDAFLNDGTQRSLRMVGTYGGVEHRDVPTDLIGRPRTNDGTCVESGCDRKQATAKMCTKHYQRLLKRRSK